MTTPTTMTTSMVTTATTMMTGVIIAPSLGGLMVGCMLLLTGAVPFLVIVPTVWGEVVVGGGVVSSGFDAVETKGITWHHGTKTQIAPSLQCHLYSIVKGHRER